MLGDNSPWSRDGTGLGQFGPDRPGASGPRLGRLGPAELGGSRSAPDRQGVLRLLASSQARLAAAALSTDPRLPILPYIERMRLIR